ncbi:hypothetical protein KIN20_016830 [Parelaphostrongylus tenuis]|uniref:Uncharacterized protein n=1 Tax=Parelaphostrongylus tenuis TaxID=148309 RepID=A0AAD5MH21_PARTN|nr:hypothetical protein KIN20_016830 [Parelaphostrongylus tenuis]
MVAACTKPNSDFYHAVARMGRSRGMTSQGTNVNPRHMIFELNSGIEEHFSIDA